MILSSSKSTRSISRKSHWYCELLSGLMLVLSLISIFCRIAQSFPMSKHPKRCYILGGFRKHFLAAQSTSIRRLINHFIRLPPQIYYKTKVFNKKACKRLQTTLISHFHQSFSSCFQRNEKLCNVSTGMSRHVLIKY